MKKFILLLIATLITTQAMAADYACKEAYDTKIAKLGKITHKIEDQGFLLGAGSMTVGSAFAIAGITAVALPVIFGPAVFFLGSMFYLDQKSQTLAEANSSIIESLKPLEQVNREARRSLTVYRMYQKDWELVRVNGKRERIGLRALTLSEYLEISPIDPVGDDDVTTMTEDLVKKINKSSGHNYSIEEVTSVVKNLSGTDVFCPNNKPVGFKKMVKIIKAHL